MKRIINRILKIISTAVFVTLILIIGLILFYVVRVQILTSQGKIDEVKLNFYTILTQSMYPTIDAGDIIITYKNDNDIYNTGDIITFVSTSSASKGLTITHRIVEVYQLDGVYSYKTQGDNNNVADSASVPSKNVVGKVVFKIPKAGYIQQFLVTKVGWVVAIVVPCLAIIIYDILKMFKTLAGKNDKKKKLVTDANTVAAKEKLEDVISNEEVNIHVASDDSIAVAAEEYNSVLDSDHIINTPLEDNSNINVVDNLVTDNTLPVYESSVVNLENTALAGDLDKTSDASVLSSTTPEITVSFDSLEVNNVSHNNDVDASILVDPIEDLVSSKDDTSFLDDKQLDTHNNTSSLDKSNDEEEIELLDDDSTIDSKGDDDIEFL